MRFFIHTGWVKKTDTYAANLNIKGISFFYSPCIIQFLNARLDIIWSTVESYGQIPSYFWCCGNAVCMHTMANVVIINMPIVLFALREQGCSVVSSDLRRTILIVLAVSLCIFGKTNFPSYCLFLHWLIILAWSAMLVNCPLAELWRAANYWPVFWLHGKCIAFHFVFVNKLCFENESSNSARLLTPRKGKERKGKERKGEH